MVLSGSGNTPFTVLCKGLVCIEGCWLMRIFTIA